MRIRTVLSLLAIPLVCSVMLSCTDPATNTTEMRALATVLETQIFVRGSDSPRFEYAKFDVPMAGEAVLAVVNGGTTGASTSQNVENAEISQWSMN